MAKQARRYGKRLGHFFCCPWGPVYISKRAITPGDQRLETRQQFVFDVTAEGVTLGEEFSYELQPKTFTPTTKFRYGNPNEPLRSRTHPD